jgi:hypothetical protein
LKLSLETYQESVRDHLAYRERAAAFVGVGLGKTASTLSAFHLNLCDGVSRAALVVAPLRVANLTWPNEVEKWDQFKGLRVESIRGRAPSGRAHIYTINYERLNELKDLSFCDTVIFDELTRAKNHKSERIRQINKLFTKHRRWGLTGTPRPNSLLEIFAQIRLLDDGQRLGVSYDAFQKCYFEPEDWREYKWSPLPESEQKIYRKIHDLAITLKSEDYLDIPDTFVEDIEVSLPVSCHGIYRQLEKELLAVLMGGYEIVAQNSAVLVNKLLQVTGGAVYTSMEGDEEKRTVSVLHNAKITALKQLLATMPGERVMIATNFIHERERVVAAVPGAVDGAKFKGDIEDAWNSGAIQYLVADPRSLGHGLNMQQGGRTTVWYSPNHSREAYDQFNGRLARKGQGRVTKIYRIICPGLIDDAVIEALRVKGVGQTDMMNVLSNFRKMGLALAA